MTNLNYVKTRKEEFFFNVDKQEKIMSFYYSKCYFFEHGRIDETYYFKTMPSNEQKYYVLDLDKDFVLRTTVYAGFYGINTFE